jgi:hypothetical protein
MSDLRGFYCNNELCKSGYGSSRYGETPMNTQSTGNKISDVLRIEASLNCNFNSVFHYEHISRGVHTSLYEDLLFCVNISINKKVYDNQINVGDISFYYRLSIVYIGLDNETILSRIEKMNALLMTLNTDWLKLP